MKKNNIVASSVEATDAIEQHGPLSEAEQQELARYEQQVASGTVAAALALKTIRDKKLYRAEFSTWAAYVQDRWEYSKSYSHQLMDFAETYEIIRSAEKSASGGLLLPTFERQVRPLAKLDDDKKVIVWLEAVKRANGKSPSGVLVEEVVAEKMMPAHRYKTKMQPGKKFTIHDAGGLSAERQTDTPDANSSASMIVSDDVAQQNSQDDAQNADAASTFVPGGAPASELGDGDHALSPMQEQGTQDDEGAVGGTAQDRVAETEASGEVEEAATAENEPAQRQEPVKTSSLPKASDQATRAEELAEACRLAVANDVDEDVAAKIYTAVRSIVEHSLRSMA